VRVRGQLRVSVGQSGDEPISRLPRGNAVTYKSGQLVVLGGSAAAVTLFGALCGVGACTFVLAPVGGERVCARSEVELEQKYQF